MVEPYEVLTVLNEAMTALKVAMTPFASSYAGGGSANSAACARIPYRFRPGPFKTIAARAVGARELV